MAAREVVRTYLQRELGGELGAREPAPEGVRIDRVGACPPSFYRFLYAEVGRDYRWTDRQGWSDAEIASHLAQPALTLYLLSVEGAPAGYYELLGQEDASVEIAYFGLLPQFVGRGLGRFLLDHAIREVAARGVSRVWLHTCTLDHPSALPNYLARGFQPFRQETCEVPHGPQAP